MPASLFGGGERGMAEEKKVIQIQERGNPNVSITISIEKFREVEELLENHAKLVNALSRNQQQLLEKALELGIEIR